MTGDESRSLGEELPAVDGQFSIQQASLLVSVPAPTIRSWERRYGFPVVDRSSGGHRRYSSDQLRLLRQMRDEIASGHSARTAAIRVIEEQSRPFDANVEAFLDAVHRLDSESVSRLLDAFSRTLGLARMLDEVLFPAMREVGRRWETGRCDVAHEHLATEASRAWLSRPAQTQSTIVLSDPALILLTCGPRDYHTIGLESLAALLIQRGRECRLLGARTTAETLKTAVKATGAACVILVSHLPSARRPAVEALRGIRHTNIHIFYAGNAFLGAQARRSVPGKYLGSNLGQAADLILADLTARPHRTAEDPTAST